MSISIFLSLILSLLNVITLASKRDNLSKIIINSLILSTWFLISLKNSCLILSGINSSLKLSTKREIEVSGVFNWWEILVKESFKFILSCLSWCGDSG